MSRPALTIALLALVALAGCVGGGGSEMSQEAQQLQNDSLAAMQDVNTYRFEMTMDMSGGGTSLSLDADGILNRTSERARLDMSMSGPRSLDMVMYLISDTAYVNVDGRWTTQDVSEEGMWDQNSQLQRQQELLRAGTLRITGNDTIDGVPVRVVEVDIPDDKLDELTALAQQSSGTSQGEITDATYTVYIAKDSTLLRKTSVDMTIEVQGNSFDATVSMRFFDFGTDTAIAIPEEAKEDTIVSAVTAAR